MRDMNPISEQNGSGRRDIPVAPLPPIVGEPDQNPDNIPVVPLPPIVGEPDQNPDNIPVIPLPPIVGTPDQGPAFPGPVPQGFSTVRFMNAVTDFGPLTVRVGNRVVANNLSFSNVSSYYRIADGFYTVTISSARYPGDVYFRGRVPFNSGEIITMAIVKNANGLDLVRISDRPCRNRPGNRGCIRAANLIYNSPAMDIILTDGRVAFADVRYKEVTTYKQARPGVYDFYVAQTPYTMATVRSDGGMFEDLPIILTNYFLPGFGNVEPLVSSYITVQAGGVYTIYLLGDWDSREVRVKIV